MRYFMASAWILFARSTAAGPLLALPSAPSLVGHSGLRLIADPPTIIPMLLLSETARILAMALRKASKWVSKLNENPITDNQLSAAMCATSSMLGAMQFQTCQPLARKNLWMITLPKLCCSPGGTNLPA